MSGDELDGNVLCSWGSFFEKVDFVRKLGFKFGDLLCVWCMCSISSGNLLIEGFLLKKIVNKNCLFGLNENNIVIFGDMWWNLFVSLEVLFFMSFCDVFGYMVLSILWC